MGWFGLVWVGSVEQFRFHEFPKGLGGVLSIRYGFWVVSGKVFIF